MDAANRHAKAAEADARAYKDKVQRLETQLHSSERAREALEASLAKVQAEERLTARKLEEARAAAAQVRGGV